MLQKLFRSKIHALMGCKVFSIPLRVSLVSSSPRVVLVMSIFLLLQCYSLHIFSVSTLFTIVPCNLWSALQYGVNVKHQDYFADSPSAGLDPASREEWCNACKQISMITFIWWLWGHCLVILLILKSYICIGWQNSWLLCISIYSIHSPMLAVVATVDRLLVLRFLSW